jgi:hypothetical protein
MRGYEYYFWPGLAEDENVPFDAESSWPSREATCLSFFLLVGWAVGREQLSRTAGFVLR